MLVRGVPKRWRRASCRSSKQKLFRPIGKHSKPACSQTSSLFLHQKWNRHWKQRVTVDQQMREPRVIKIFKANIQYELGHHQAIMIWMRSALSKCMQTFQSEPEDLWWGVWIAVPPIGRMKCIHFLFVSCDMPYCKDEITSRFPDPWSFSGKYSRRRTVRLMRMEATMLRRQRI